MIIINLKDMKHKNVVDVYISIQNGNDDLYSLSEDTGLSVLTVNKITNYLISKKYIEVQRIQANHFGRPRNKFVLTNNYFCVLIKKYDGYFTILAITTSGTVVFNFELALDYKGSTYQGVFDYTLQTLKENPKYKYNMGIFLVGDDENDIVPPDYVDKLSCEELITYSYINDKIIQLFEFENINILSLYGHTSKVMASKSEICKVLNIDESYNFGGNITYEVHESLKKITFKRIINKL